jgi:hypothetical protein
MAYFWIGNGSIYFRKNGWLPSISIPKASKSERHFIGCFPVKSVNLPSEQRAKAFGQNMRKKVLIFPSGYDLIRARFFEIFFK